MITQVNPGTLLEVSGSFELKETIGGDLYVADRESGATVDLARLLRSFLEDPDDMITGPIRIRIEAAPLARGAAFDRPFVYGFYTDDPGGLWRMSDLAEDLGPESPGSAVRSFRIVRTGQIIALSDPAAVLRRVV